MKYPILLFTILLIFLTTSVSYSQDTLDFISNPSFEDTPRKGGHYNNASEASRNNINGWFDCGIIKFMNETAPDIHGGKDDYWSVNMLPSEGETFIGLVTRDNNSWEELSQELAILLKEGYCYNFTVDLAKADPYISGSRLLKEDKPNYSYSNAVRLIIWGGLGYCNISELLYESPPIDNTEWKTYDVTLQPQSEWKYISIQAFFIDKSGDPYNGNILIDNISRFIVTECEE